MRRPLLWGFVYLALIPLFAFIYDGLGAGSFYDANIQREPGLRQDALGIIDAITHVIDVNPPSLLWHTSAGPVFIDPASLEVTALRHTADGKLLIELSGRYMSAPNVSITLVGSFSEWLRILTFKAKTVVTAPGGPTLTGYGTTLSDMDGNLISPTDGAPPPSLLLPAIPGGSSPPNSPNGILLLPIPVFQRLDNFYRAAEGDPWYASGRWLRMAYLSAVTVTTLGFGDVTPVTGTARAFVALEAVLGLVMIGLFVNAVARRR